MAKTTVKVHVLTLTDQSIECILNSFNAQAMRIKEYIKEADKKGLKREVNEWNKLQAKANRTAKTIREQTGRLVPGKNTDTEDPAASPDLWDQILD